MTFWTNNRLNFKAFQVYHDPYKPYQYNNCLWTGMFSHSFNTGFIGITLW